MKHYSITIFLLVQLLLVQSDDPVPTYFYQKLMAKQRKSLTTASFSTDDTPVIPHPSWSYKVFDRRSVHRSNRDLGYQVMKHEEELRKIHALLKEVDSIKGKCRRKFCSGKIKICHWMDMPCGTEPRRTYDGPTLLIILGGLLLAFCPLLMCYACIRLLLYSCHSTDLRNNGAITNSANIELLPTTTTVNRLSSYLEATRQRIELFNFQNSTTQSLIRETPSRNATTSTELQQLENNIDNVRRAPTTSVERHTLNSPPAYDDTMRQSSIITTMREQSSLLPSYDEFIRRNNEKFETSF